MKTPDTVIMSIGREPLILVILSAGRRGDRSRRTCGCSSEVFDRASPPLAILSVKKWLVILSAGRRGDRSRRTCGCSSEVFDRASPPLAILSVKKWLVILSAGRRGDRSRRTCGCSSELFGQAELIAAGGPERQIFISGVLNRSTQS